MDANDQARREKEIFEQALDAASAAERLAFLKGACGADAALLARVQALLQAHETAREFLPGEPAGQTIPVGMDEKPGDRIGRYKLREKIGEGGCGVVYVAEQEEPVRRKVALKVIKLGMDTKQVIARFEAERQALAMMDNPHIAKVLDAGATDTGRPYFVMELVRGIRITDYCDQNNLPTQERL
ncbi:MAG TPA: protein kinase, partial [Dongiaceae bacterium]|nr:protein kinase [Dongiaceae bacterium]